MAAEIFEEPSAAEVGAPGVRSGVSDTGKSEALLYVCTHTIYDSMYMYVVSKSFLRRLTPFRLRAYKRLKKCITHI